MGKQEHFKLITAGKYLGYATCL